MSRHIIGDEAKKSVRELAFEAISNGWVERPIVWPIRGGAKDLLIGLIRAFNQEPTDPVTYEYFENEMLDALEKWVSKPEEVLIETMRRRGVSFSKHRAGADWADGAFEISKRRFIVVEGAGEGYSLVKRTYTKSDEIRDRELARSQTAVGILDKAK